MENLSEGDQDGAWGDTWGLRTAFTVAAIVPLLALPLLKWLPGRKAA